MLTRFVRIQLAIFVVASLVGISLMIVKYIQAPTLLGIGRMTVTMELPDAGGLYRFANVTYRGVEIGKVTEMDADRSGASATLSLSNSVKVPADLTAEVRSLSAVGEQYVELLPRTQAGPYLHDGSVIYRSDTVIPQQVGPMLDQVSSLVNSIPKDKLSGLLDESFKAFNGAGPDLQSLADSSATFAADLKGVANPMAALIEDSATVLESQAASADALRTWTGNLAGITAQLSSNDPQLRTLLDTGPGAAQEVSRLLTQLKPTLPVLLANMSSLGQIAVTYRPGLEQLLVLIPPSTAYYQGSAGTQNNTGIPIGDFRISVSDPPACTVGFLPPSAWRNPADTSTVDTPDGLYCKLPQDSPLSVRGARNYPCMDAPGKYAPTVQECKSDKPFQPIAKRQHALGPYPLDPNLIAQGIPPDKRVTQDEHIFGPIDGTPPPPGVAPSGFTHGDPTASQPPLVVTHYDPSTGKYATPGGGVHVQSNLSGGPTDWQSLVLAEGQ